MYMAKWRGETQKRERREKEGKVNGYHSEVGIAV
jgi:hypothetical protein